MCVFECLLFLPPLTLTLSLVNLHRMYLYLHVHAMAVNVDVRGQLSGVHSQFFPSTVGSWG